MIDILRKFSSNPLIWLFHSWIVVFLPLILVGDPGFYGDDYNSFQIINEQGGAIGAITEWLTV